MISPILKFVLEAIRLTKGIDKNFSDWDLSQNLDLSKKETQAYLKKAELGAIFRTTTLRHIKCPLCGSTSELVKNIEPFCKKCGHSIDTSSIGDIQINLQYDTTQSFIEQNLLSILKTTGFVEVKKTNSAVILTKDDITIALSINLRNLRINDFFILKGMIEQEPLPFLVLFGTSADLDLISISQKDPQCILHLIFDIENPHFLENFVETLEKRQQIIYENIEAEKIAGYKYEEIAELEEVKNTLNTMLESLPVLALQKGSASSSSQGKTFQKNIVSLLNFTLFNARYLGGRNEPDGIIQLFSIGSKPMKPIWIPLEIKTYKQSESTIYDINEVSLQLSKYSDVLEKDEIACRVDVPAFLTIAYEFNLENNNQNETINELERTHRIKYSFMPLNSFIHLVKIFVDNPVSKVPSDAIQDLFTQNRLITKEIIDALYKKIQSREDIDQGLLRYLRKEVKKQGS